MCRSIQGSNSNGMQWKEHLIVYHSVLQTGSMFFLQKVRRLQRQVSTIRNHRSIMITRGKYISNLMLKSLNDCITFVCFLKQMKDQLIALEMHDLKKDGTTKEKL
eukprot:Gb_10358 [translate_table: standard]